MEEVWKDIPGYEGKYQISSWGRVKSLNYHYTGKEGFLTPRLIGSKNKQYYAVHFTNNGRCYDYKIHQLVAEAFIPNPDNLPEIDHIDGNSLNNISTNLQWCTHKENMNNLITKSRLVEANKGKCIGRHMSDESKKKLSESRKGIILKSMRKPVLCLKDNQIIKRYDALNDVKKDGFTASAVSLCCRGKK